MRATTCSDGVKRINAKIEVPMTHVDVSDYVLSAVSGEVVTLESVQQLNKRQLLQVAKEEVYNYGVSVPRQRAKEVDTKTNIIIRNYVKNMFPEID
jgi:hypothetical protein